MDDRKECLAGDEGWEGSGWDWAGERRCLRRVKKITTMTVQIPRREPMTGPTIQTEESCGAGGGRVELRGVLVEGK